jgi:hypothetical protein
MTQSGQADFEGTLIESQGVNAGDAIDAAETLVPRKPPGAERIPPPTPRELSESLTDEMVGLPEQRPGYPGQQRSMDTS